MGSIGGTGGSALNATPDARRRVELDRLVLVERVERVDSFCDGSAGTGAGGAPTGASPQTVQ